MDTVVDDLAGAVVGKPVHRAWQMSMFILLYLRSRLWCRWSVEVRLAIGRQGERLCGSPLRIGVLNLSDMVVRGCSISCLRTTYWTHAWLKLRGTVAGVPPGSE